MKDEKSKCEIYYKATLAVRFLVASSYRNVNAVYEPKNDEFAHEKQYTRIVALYTCRKQWHTMVGDKGAWGKGSAIGADGRKE